MHLRHLLETVLLQVNTDFAPSEEDETERSPEEQRDARLTESFRGFGERG